MDPAATDRSGLGPADVLASDGSAHTEFPESRLDPPSTAPSVPVHVRNVALVVLAVIACIAVLHWAAAVIVPLLLGIVFSTRSRRWSIALSAGTCHGRWRPPCCCSPSLAVRA